MTTPPPFPFLPPYVDLNAHSTGVGSRGRAHHGQRRQEDGGERGTGADPHLLAGEGLGHHPPLHEHGEL